MTNPEDGETYPLVVYSVDGACYNTWAGKFMEPQISMVSNLIPFSAVIESVPADPQPGYQFVPESIDACTLDPAVAALVSGAPYHEGADSVTDYIGSAAPRVSAE